jgi:rubrerythrin
VALRWSMRTDISESLRVCIAVEATTAEIYHGISRLFPQVKSFWQGLALSEENHTKILLEAARLHRAGILNEDIVPASLPHVYETFALVRDSKKAVESGTLTLRNALEMALEIENSTGESYFQEVMGQETDSEVVSKLRDLLIDEEMHKNKIQKVMNSMGFHNEPHKSDTS